MKIGLAYNINSSSFLQAGSTIHMKIKSFFPVFWKNCVEFGAGYRWRDHPCTRFNFIIDMQLILTFKNIITSASLIYEPLKFALASKLHEAKL